MIVIKAQIDMSGTDGKDLQIKLKPRRFIEQRSVA